MYETCMTIIKQTTVHHTLKQISEEKGCIIVWENHRYRDNGEVRMT